MVAAKIATLKEGRPNKTAAIAAVSQSEASRLLNVSIDTIQRCKKVLDECTPLLVEKVEQGIIAASTAADLTDLNEEEQEEIVARGEAAILRAAKEFRQAKRAVNEERRLEILRRPVAIPAGKYRCLVIDPPRAPARPGRRSPQGSRR
jgi:hypothetical protein